LIPGSRPDRKGDRGGASDNPGCGADVTELQRMSGVIVMTIDRIQLSQQT